MGVNIGYVGIDHHHRDPYFAVASELDATITAVCEPGRRVDVDSITAMDERPDEVTTEGQNVTDLVAGAAVYENPHELVADNSIDVVWITYRSSETPAIIESAVENGVHVISEKPIARTAADLEDIAQQANDIGVTVAPTMYYRRNPIAMELRDKVQDGFFGDIWTVDGRFNASQLSNRNTDHYIYDRETSRGGALQWIGPHWVDIIPWILDDPITRVNAEFHEAAEADVEAGAVLQFETRSGTLGTYHTGYYLNDRGKDTHLGIYGTDAQALTALHHDSLQHEPTVPLEITSDNSDWTAAPTRTTEFEFSYDRFSEWGDFVQDYFEAYFEGYETGDVPATVDDAVQLLRVLDAAYESGEQGSWVEVVD
ncbi:Gfo/Idh/MocA family oxidoreductase [Haladaptatus sp. DYF46]|uniref:Gfo/Idh/MocA family protein n=1 Tax=Haladaptatus sp. DYF46 TaxID=2886041 RepID=UPI001E64801B|nr:Gfo/Idh/MocA family oxidoreductase [Haladaptatus sp. DYF46]